MAYFDRFDICEAYALLENWWNVGGVLWQRPLCRHRSESIGVVLHRIGYCPSPMAGTYEHLSDNAREIFWQAVKRLNLPVVTTVDKIRLQHYAGA